MKKYLLLLIFFFTAFVPTAFASRADVTTIPYVTGLQNSDLYSYQSTLAGNPLLTIEQDSNGYFYWATPNPTSNYSIVMASTTPSAPNYSASFPSVGSGWNGYAIYTRVGGSDNRMRIGASFTSSVGSVVSSFNIDGVGVSLVKWNGFTATSSGNVLGSGFQISAARAGEGRMYLITYTDENLDYIDTQAEYYAYVDALGVGGPIGGDITTRITAQNTPTNGDLSDSQFVIFDFDYFNNDNDLDPIAFAGVDVRDVSSGFEYSPPESAVIISGNGSFSTTLQLAEGHFHMWRPYLRSASSTRIVYGSWYSFDVVSFSGQFDPLDPDADMATSTALGRFFSQQGYLARKFPFAYFYDVASIVGEINDDATETNFPTLTLNMASSSLPIGNLEFLSKDTVEMFAGSSAVALFRTLMASALWLFFAYAVYIQIKRLFHH